MDVVDLLYRFLTGQPMRAQGDRCRWCVRKFNRCMGGADRDFPELCWECAHGARRPADFIERANADFPAALNRWMRKQYRAPQMEVDEYELLMNQKIGEVDAAAARHFAAGRLAEGKAKRAEAERLRKELHQERQAMLGALAGLEREQREREES